MTNPHLGSSFDERLKARDIARRWLLFYQPQQAIQQPKTTMTDQPPVSMHFHGPVYGVAGTVEGDQIITPPQNITPPTPTPSSYLKRTRLQQQLQDLLAEHEATFQASRSTIDPTAQIRLQRKLEQLEAEIAQLEQNLENLQ